MAPTAEMVNELLNTLETEDYNTVISFIQFLSLSRRKEKEEKSLSVLKEIQNMFNDDNPWDSEDEMLKEMAEFRRERLK